MTDGSRATTPPIERVLAGRRDRRSAAKDIASRVALSVDLGLLHPLEQLPRDEELATAFGVAPITVRRALRRLCDEGILVRRRGRTGGTFVSERPPRGELHRYEVERARLSGEVFDLLDFRLVLETGLVRLAVHSAGEQDVLALRRLVEAMDAAPDWAAFRPLDQRFHLALAAIAGGSRAHEELTAVLGELGKLYFPHPLDVLRQSNREHQAIVDAIAERDERAALAVVERHLAATKTTFSWIREAELRRP